MSSSKKVMVLMDIKVSRMQNQSARPRILFVCRDDDNKKIMFSSVPQPQNPEGNSYAVSADHLAPFSTFSDCGGERLSLTLPRLKWRVRRNGRRSHLLGYDPIAKEFKVQCCIPHWPTPKSICIGGVLYYKTVSGTADSYSNGDVYYCYLALGPN
ncbi:hypothetical protein F2Q69_00018034 [Brassica cretica]|uniref:F-box associated domain-containing protein n=1 Tax=Brassica cretica TaxID=69181 RepID=A0A8S9QSW5_BRACR|nr:hypothetical protein F2Q69_00018034 [Brassica cretica]